VREYRHVDAVKATGCSTTQSQCIPSKGAIGSFFTSYKLLLEKNSSTCYWKLIFCRAIFLTTV